MHDIVNLFCEVIDDIENSGIETGNITEKRENKRLSKALGRCRKYPDGHFEIEIQSAFMQDNIEEQGLKNTIAHEILHTCRNSFNHGAEWKRNAETLQAFCPEYTITRCTDARKYGYKPKERTYRHVYKCEECGQVIKRQRASNFCQRYICGCGGQFTEM